jgi:2-polyprenyl-6-methoxyphenol hydroxylase-like FAD-dependent oxidoreductase
MQTRVGSIGAGAAGLFLALLLRRAGIGSIAPARTSKALPPRSAGALCLIRELGLAERMAREGHFHAASRWAGVTLLLQRMDFTVPGSRQLLPRCGPRIRRSVRSARSAA